MTDQQDLFGNIKGMVRKGDPMTCFLAATGVERKASLLHENILMALQEGGPMTDQELEDLPQFRHYAYSTVRKRRTELYQSGLVTSIGTKKNRRNQTMLIWTLNC